MKVGIIGLEFSGKKTLFTLLTGISHNPSGHDKKEIGVVNIPDDRVDYLGQFYNTKKLVYSQIEFNLIPSIKKDSDETKKALIEAREMDMFGVVIRQFNNENVFHPFEKIDIQHDYNVIKDELLLADLMVIETRLERIEKQLKSGDRDRLAKEKELLLRLKKPLEAGSYLKEVILNEEEKKILKGFQLLSLKPIFAIINCDDDKLNENFKLIDKIETLNISVNIENDIRQLKDEKEKNEFFESLGIKESSLNRLIKFAFSYGNLISFLTASEKDVHAWTVRNGANAVQAAGVIHSDFEKGFIRAEVISYEDLKRAGSEAEAKKMGLFRLEGKEYIVKDGDIIVFRFNL